MALEINPQHPIALNELGIVYRKTARFAEARQSYEAALAVYPGYHYARRNLAVLCDLYLSDLECAADNYEAYMATVHSDEEAAMWLRDVNFRLVAVEDDALHFTGLSFYRINEDLLHVYIALNSNGETTEHKLIYNRTDN